jgi:thiamine kinase-like enzyme
LVEAAHERIPRGLSHNDVPPGNALKIDGVTTFVDFGLAGFAPLEATCIPSFVGQRRS